MCGVTGEHLVQDSLVSLLWFIGEKLGRGLENGFDTTWKLAASNVLILYITCEERIPYLCKDRSGWVSVQYIHKEITVTGSGTVLR